MIGYPDYRVETRPDGLSLKSDLSVEGPIVFDPKRKLTAAEADALMGGEFMDLFRNQLLICAINRLGGKLNLPVSEVDATGKFSLHLEVDQVAKTFIFETRRLS